MQPLCKSTSVLSLNLAPRGSTRLRLFFPDHIEKLGKSARVTLTRQIRNAVEDGHSVRVQNKLQADCLGMGVARLLPLLAVVLQVLVLLLKSTGVWLGAKAWRTKVAYELQG